MCLGKSHMSKADQNKIFKGHLQYAPREQARRRIVLAPRRDHGVDHLFVVPHLSLGEVMQGLQGTGPTQ